MSVSVSRYKNKGLSIVSAVFLVVGASAFGLMSCGGGGDSTPPLVVNQVASGLFKSGTAELDAGAVLLNDLRAFVHGNRVIAFSISQHILFDGQVTAITGDDFTATVNLYETGALTQADIAVTGKVTSQSQVTGTLAGTGVGSGTFTLTYDMAYDTTASLTKIDKISDFEGDLLSISSFITDTQIDSAAIIAGVVGVSYNDEALSISCNFLGTAIVPDPNINIYSLNQDLPLATTPGYSLNALCDLPLGPVIKYTGFASLLSESSVENDMLYAVTNGSFAVFGLLSQP